MSSAMPPRRVPRGSTGQDQGTGQAQQQAQGAPAQHNIDMRSVLVLAQKGEYLVAFAAKARQPAFGTTAFTSVVTDSGGMRIPYEGSAADRFVVEGVQVDYSTVRTLCEEAARDNLYPPQCPLLGADHTLEGLRLLGLAVSPAWCLYFCGNACTAKV